MGVAVCILPQGGRSGVARVGAQPRLGARCARLGGRFRRHVSSSRPLARCRDAMRLARLVTEPARSFTRAHLCAVGFPGVPGIVDNAIAGATGFLFAPQITDIVSRVACTARGCACVLRASPHNTRSAAVWFATPVACLGRLPAPPSTADGLAAAAGAAAEGACAVQWP